ncbi:LIM-bind multi-domain protein [Pyrenophora tritici-repentis]|nr:BetA, Choline dehydrogenase [Pyrenophora tritici-repentis]PZC99783.1 LIM-bind multi-domain protein [Pyrenophora tritici-repentis]PZD32131.1 LIM-bind multi-domain protein [Pyrenophora tritici-repentis]
MMTTSYPNHGGMHPQGMQHTHPGMGGPGQNQGQPGMPPGMQHVSGPNGPVSQAGPMMGMQPGMGNNAHALSHLQPQQPHMFPQQQQHQMMNPTMIQQRNAQQAYMQRQQQQAMLAHQQGGMGMAFQNPMANMNQAQAQQQLQAMRNGQMGQGPFVNLPPHLLQQQQQMGGQPGGPQHQAAMAQAQAQAAHQAQQHQQMQAQQQAIAMQHAQSQSSQMQQRNPALAQAQAQAAAQQNQVRQMALMQQQKQAQSQSQGQGTLKLLNFVEQIGRFDVSQDENKQINNVERWQAFVDKFFTETGSFINVVCSPSADRSKQFEIVYAALPRYFYTLFRTDVTNLQITLDGATEKSQPPELKVTCDRAKFIYTYKNSCQLVYHGKLTAFWSGSDKMEWLMFDGACHEQFIPFNALRSLFVQPSPNQMNPNQSPRMKNKKAQQQRAGQEIPQPYLPFNKLPSTGTTDYGLPQGLQNYLEIYESMNHMTSLMAHCIENPHMKPSEALESWNNTMSNNQAVLQGGQNPGQQQPQGMQPNMQPGIRPPGPGQPGPMFMSPAMQNSLLPNGSIGGSPHFQHTPSPNSQPMMKQQSTSSHTMSVNTSPNMNNKRRRSTAKIEMDDGGGEMNG